MIDVGESNCEKRETLRSVRTGVFSGVVDGPAKRGVIGVVN